MFEFLKRLFCKHNYGMVGTWSCTYSYNGKKETPVPVYFFECTKCHARKVIKDSDMYYTTHISKLIRLWLKGQIIVDFKDDGRVVIRGYRDSYDENN